MPTARLRAGRPLAGCVLLASLASCVRAAAPAPVLPVVATDGNPGKVALGKIVAVVDVGGGSQVVFSDVGAVVLEGGALAVSDRSVHDWRAGAEIPAADGRGRWVIGVDASGHVHKLQDAALEDVTDRFGVAPLGVARVVPLGGRAVAFAGAHGLAISDGSQSRTYPAVGESVLAGGGGRLATAAGNVVHVWDPARAQVATYPIAGAIGVVFLGDGKLAVANRDAIWLERSGRLVRLPGELMRIHGLAADGAKLWVAAGDGLFVVEDGVVRRTSGAPVGDHAWLAPAPSGGVWVVDGAELHRIEPAPITGARGAWDADIRPIFGKVCSRCHLDGGTADLDLSTEAMWRANRREIQRRVVDKKTMPPAGTPFDEAERGAIAAWLRATP